MRKPQHEYFMVIALTVAKRATCDRSHVGCVIVSPKSAIVSTGYNGSVRGKPHCDDVGHEMDANGSCIRTVHAEANAIAQAAMHGMSVAGCTAFVTHSPCYYCQKLLANSGVTAVVYEVAYREDPATCSRRINERTGLTAFSMEEATAYMHTVKRMKGLTK